MQITHQMCQRLISISVLQARFPEVLSDFEATTCQTAKDRALGLIEPETTDAEWQVVEAAGQALRAAQHKNFAIGKRRGLRVDAGITGGAKTRFRFKIREEELKGH